MRHEPELVSQTDPHNEVRTDLWWQFFVMFLERNGKALDYLREEAPKAWRLTIRDESRAWHHERNLTFEGTDIEDQKMPMRYPVRFWPYDHEYLLRNRVGGPEAFRAVSEKIEVWLNAYVPPLLRTNSLRGCALSAVVFWVDERRDYPVSEMQFVPVYIPDKRLTVLEQRKIVNSFLGKLTNEIYYYPAYESREARVGQLRSVFDGYFIEPFCSYVEGIYLQWGYERWEDQKERRKSIYDLMGEHNLIGDPFEWFHLRKVEGKSYGEIENVELTKYQADAPKNIDAELASKREGLKNDAEALLKMGELYKRAASKLSQIALLLDEQPTYSNNELSFNAKVIHNYAERLKDLVKAVNEEAVQKKRVIEKCDQIINSGNQEKINDSFLPTERTIRNKVRELCQKMGVKD